jgi:hypothetical protein
MLDTSGTQHLLLAETLGLAMARRASDILERHRAALAGGPPAANGATEPDDGQFAQSAPVGCPPVSPALRPEQA